MKIYISNGRELPRGKFAGYTGEVEDAEDLTIYVLRTPTPQGKKPTITSFVAITEVQANEVLD